VQAALLQVEGVDSVEVAFTDTVVWTPERISEAGRDKLRAFGIAPPGSGQVPPDTTGDPRRRGVVVTGIGGVTCPLCGSRDTVVDSPFGPTPCRSANYCNACRNPFEAVKP
jgi:ring-1,2-phenylacetyl-CoA epoxidase subunit PaaD